MADPSGGQKGKMVMESRSNLDIEGVRSLTADEAIAANGGTVSFDAGVWAGAGLIAGGLPGALAGGLAGGLTSSGQNGAAENGLVNWLAGVLYNHGWY